MKRYRLWIQQPDGGEDRVGNRAGYKTESDAFRQAESIAKQTGHVVGVGLFDVFEGEWDCREVLGFVSDNDQ